MSARLPKPGGDTGDWGTILNGFLEVAHNSDGSLKSSAISSAGGVTKVNGKSPSSGAVTLTASDVGAGTYSKPAGGIPSTDMTSAVQSDLTLASTAYQKPNTGIPSTDLTSAVQTSLDKANSSVQIGGDLGGTSTSPTVAKLQGTSLNGSSPTDGQVLTYSNGANAWVPGTVSNTTVNDATTSSKGIVELAGDLSGTASSPTVVSTHLASALPVNQGGTGATTQNFVDLSSGQTIGGTKTFSNTIAGSISGNAATVTTNANLTGDVTSSGNATTVAKLQGVAISGTPSANQVLTASGSTAAAWSTPASAPVTSVAGKTGAVTLAEGDITNLTTDLAARVQIGGDLGNTATSPQVTSTHLSSALPINQGGTGSGTQNFVDLSSTQSSIAGAKTFTSTLTAPISDKGGEVFNVMAYGATGNGTTADDTAIQAAISAAVTAGGGIVYLPIGNYKLTTGLSMHSKVTLRGEGGLVSTLRPASGVTAITAPGSSGAQITQTIYEDFGVVGPGQGVGSAPGISITWSTTGTQFSRLYVQLCGGDGIIASNSYTVQMRDCILSSNGANGVNAQTNVNSWDMAGNTSLLNTQWGYYIMGGAAGVLHSCDAESNGYGGVAILGTFSFTVEGGEYENNGASGSGQQCGIYLGSGSGSYTTAHNTILRGNWLQGTSVANYGIVVDGADMTLIENNGFQNNLTNHISVTANASSTRLGANNYFSSPSSGNIADAGTATQQLGFDSTNSVMRSSGLSFGSITGNADVTLTRAAAGRMLLSGGSSSGQILKITNTSASTSVPNLYLSGTAGTDLAFGTVYTGNSFLPFQMTSAGKMEWGSGSANNDTSLLRTAAGVLQVNSAISAAGLTGATATSRYVGATASGAPSSGTFAVGDFVIDQTGAVWICTGAGSPGTWTSVSVAPGNATSSTLGLIQLTGDLGNSATNPQVTSTHLSSALPVNQGGTGSTSKNFVDLSTVQTIGGNKTWSADQYFESGRPWYDVIAFGADPTAAADSTTAIQNAINAATATSGGIVFFPVGNYKCTSVLTANSSKTVTLLGCGGVTAGAGGASHILYTGTGSTSFLSANNSAGFHVKDLQLIYGSSSFTGNILDLRNISGSDTAFFRVEGCLIGGAGISTANAGIALDKANTGMIEGCNFINATYGISGAASAGSYSNNVSVRGCQFVGLGTASLLNPGQAWLIAGNTFEGLGSGGAGGIVCNAATFIGSEIIGNWFGDVTAGIGGTQMTLSGGGFSITGNYIGYNTGASGISIGASNIGFTITGNQFAAFSGATAISLGASCTAYDCSRNSTGGLSMTFPSPLIDAISAGTVTLAANPTSALQAATKQYVDGVPVALTDAATIAIDASQGKLFRVTLGGNRTLGNPTNSRDGQIIVLEVTQDSTGGRTLSYGTNYEFSPNLPQPTLSATTGTTDYLQFIYNASATKWRFLAFNSGF